MDTFVLDRGDRLIFTNRARVVRAQDEVSADLAAAVPSWDVERASPYVKWITGSYVEADNPNSNGQFWTRGDLELAEYTIRYSPLNMVHNVRRPVGFFASTKTVEFQRDQAGKGMRVEALAGLWAHVFPFESALVDQADEQQLLFFSMECVGSHLICGGPQGCGQQYAYSDVENQCAHLKERSSVRHIVNPIFRGGALIIPPVKPGWKDAHANVYQQAVLDAAYEYAEQTESAYASVQAEGAALTPAAWEALMAAIIQTSGT